MITNPNTFANYPLDKAGHRRKDEVWLNEALNSDAARIIPFRAMRPLLLLGPDGKTNGESGWLSTHARAPLGGRDAMTIFLGTDEVGAPHFAMEAPAGREEGDRLLEGMGEFSDLRPAASILAPGDTSILGAAKAIFEWHGRHKFCSNCGTPTISAEGGWRRDCPACQGQHFPRVDPVAIMIAICNDKCLLGRGKAFGAGFFSALAGYVEPGESMEEACARELMEEAGVRATEVRYLFTQPWPFPSSLMIGFIAQVDSEALRVDEDELAEARWFTRGEIDMLLNRRHPECFIPQPMAIAHQIIRTWAERK